MVQELVTTVVDFLKNEIPPELIAFVISLFPVLEIRGGMIASLLLEIDFFKAFLICYIGNMIPIPFILLFIRKIFAFMRKIILEIPALFILNALVPMYGLAYAQLFAEIVLATSTIFFLIKIFRKKKKENPIQSQN